MSARPHPEVPRHRHLGNIETTNTLLIQIDAMPPVSSITCDGKSCAAGYYNGNGAVSRSSATDLGSRGGGDPLHHQQLDADGVEPVYTSALTLSASRWMKFRAYDSAGNVGPVVATLVKVNLRADGDHHVADRWSRGRRTCR